MDSKYRILNIIEEETPGKCFKSNKVYINDSDDTPDRDNDIRIVTKKSGETDEISTYKDLTPIVNILEKPLFKYFLDGSRRIFKIDDINYDQKVFPLIAGQVSVGCSVRNNFKISKQDVIHENVIVLPDIANADGHNSKQFFENLKTQINKKSIFLNKHGIKIDKILYQHDDKDKDFKNLSIAKIQDYMIEKEKSLVSSLVKQNLLKDNAYLVKDGSLEYSRINEKDEFSYNKIKDNYNYVIGVSKQFNPSLLKDKNNKSLAKTIAELPLFSRTPALYYECSRIDAKISIWYLRIRDSRYSFSPFDGVIKVEKILISEDEKEYGLSTDTIDTISANLIRERNPVCYGSDKRWANHLYPIFLTEELVKSYFLSDSFFLNMF